MPAFLLLRFSRILGSGIDSELYVCKNYHDHEEFNEKLLLFEHKRESIN